MSLATANPYTDIRAFPIFWDVTTLGTPRPTQSDLPWLRQLEGDATGAEMVVLLASSLSGQEEWHRPSFLEGTSPSESGVILILDATEARVDDLTALVIAAELGDETRFLKAASQIDWSLRPASDFDRGIRLALAAGAHLFARSLAVRGTDLYPRHQELQKMARILAPPRVVRTHLPPDPSMRANQAWLVEHAAEYRGRWVALEQGNLVASATTVAELRSQFTDIAGKLITKVS